VGAEVFWSELGDYERDHCGGERGSAAVREFASQSPAGRRDGGVVITGSFNFSKAAEESNAENVLVNRDAALAGKYERNWQEHYRHSEVYRRVNAKPSRG
jgi:hypothetical protein